MRAHLSGAFPRSEALVELTRASARGRVPPDELDVAFTRESAELVELQNRAGLDTIVDGQLNWSDLYRPFSELFVGIQPGSLTRWFDNNTFYKKPVIVGKVRYKGTHLDKYFKNAKLPKACYKAILPGPYTFSVMSQDTVYTSSADLIDDLAHSLRDIVYDLEKVGYEFFQFNEPWVGSGEPSKDELVSLRQAYETLLKGRSTNTALHTYFGDISKAIDVLLDSPAESIGIDFYATTIDSLVGHDFTKEIACGLIDARNSLLESLEASKKLVLRIQRELNPRGISLIPNCDLDFLPREVALRKLDLLTKAKKMIE